LRDERFNNGGGKEGSMKRIRNLLVIVMIIVGSGMITGCHTVQPPGPPGLPKPPPIPVP
jgi:predicted small secreted protein